MSYKPDPPKDSRNEERQRKTWDSCYSCFRDLEISGVEQAWRECSRCSTISRGLVVFLTIAALVTLWFHWYYTNFSSWKLNLYTLGYLVDILGGWFLATGLSDLFALASSGFGGGGATFKKFGYGNFRKRAIGLFFLTLGFLFQSIANVASAPSPSPAPVLMAAPSVGGK